MDQLFKTADDIIELLEKKCPRCGKPSAQSGNPAGRCSACLSKLRENKKKPGTYQHEQKLADDALRRQKGKNGTAHKKSKGLGTRKEIIAKVRAAYKKHGNSTTLSPDRKDNSKGYSSENTRMVPKKLNRGRHHVNPKKLASWEHKLKKHGVECEAFSKAIQAGDLDLAVQELELLKASFISPEQQKTNRQKAMRNNNIRTKNSIRANSVASEETEPRDWGGKSALRDHIMGLVHQTHSDLARAATRRGDHTAAKLHADLAAHLRDPANVNSFMHRCLVDQLASHLHSNG